MRRAPWFVLLLTSAACLDLGYTPDDFRCTNCVDAGRPDGNVLSDAGPRDGGVADAGGRDAGPPRTIYRQRIDIETVPLNETLTDFPLLIEMSAVRVDYTVMQADGSDLRFFAQNGTRQLQHEIERWVSGGTSYVRVKTDIFPATVGPTFLFIEYGDDSLPALSPQEAAQTWDSNFSAVVHFEDGNAALSDEVGLAGTPVGGVVTDGVISDGMSLSASGAFVDLPLGRLDSDDGTACLWIRASPLSNHAVAFYASSVSGGDGFGPEPELNFGLSDTGTADFFMRGDGSPFGDLWYDSFTDVTDNQWHQICATWARSGSVQQYVDGDPAVGGDHYGLSFVADRVLRLGRTDAQKREFGGDVDELQLSRVDRSDGWIWFEHRMTRNQGLITFGPRTP